MKIGMILDAYYPEDIRITKEATALVKAGHEVFLLCKGRKTEEQYSTVNGIQITRIIFGNHLYIKTFWDTLNAIFWKHFIFDKELPKFIKKNKIDILHVHDLPLANTVIEVGKKNNLKVILDMHENFPAGLQTWSSEKSNPIVKLKNKLFFNYKRWSNYERDMIQKVDKVIAVVEEMKNRLISLYNLPDNKVITISNTEPTSFVDNKVIDPIVSKYFEGKFVFSYIGGFGPHRGLDTAIKSLNILKDNIPNIRFLLVGRGSNLQKLKRLVSTNKLEKYVEFIGFQPFSKVFSFMALSDINVIPHHKNEHTDNTIPHKLFQTLMVGKPVLVSSATPLKRVVEEINGGFVFDASNSESFADQVLFIYKNEKEIKRRVDNAQKHTLNGNLNWETTAQVLTSFYDELTAEKVVHPV